MYPRERGVALRLRHDEGGARGTECGQRGLPRRARAHCAGSRYLFVGLRGVILSFGDSLVVDEQVGAPQNRGWPDRVEPWSAPSLTP